MLDFSHCINLTLALADQTAPACIDTRLLCVQIPSKSKFICAYIPSLYFCLSLCTLFLLNTQRPSFIKLLWNKVEKMPIYALYNTHLHMLNDSIKQTASDHQLCFFNTVSRLLNYTFDARITAALRSQRSAIKENTRKWRKHDQMNLDLTLLVL